MGNTSSCIFQSSSMVQCLVFFPSPLSWLEQKLSALIYSNILKDRLGNLCKTYKICLFLILATHYQWNGIFFTSLLQETGKFTVIKENKTKYIHSSKSNFFKIYSQTKRYFLTKELTVLGKIYFHLTLCLLRAIQIIKSFHSKITKITRQFSGLPVLSFK